MKTNRIQCGYNRSKPVRRVRHAMLQRVNGSAYSSQCPLCSPGTLVMKRDEHTFELLSDDRCLYCGQRFFYTDLSPDGVLPNGAR